jgi:molecular chaperone GrpE
MNVPHPEMAPSMAETADEAVVATGAVVDHGGTQAETARLQDRSMRALAETENVRRRGERGIADARTFAVQDFARALLPVADNLSRGVAAAMNGQGTGPVGHAALLEGVQATERILTGTLEHFGIRKMEVLGTPFDPNSHEAMLEIDDAAHPAGTVVAVLEDGFTLHDRLLRPARVSVAKGPTGVAPTV